MAAVGTMYSCQAHFKYTPENVEIPDVMFKAPTYLIQDDLNVQVSDELKRLKRRQDQLLQDLDVLIKKVTDSNGVIETNRPKVAPKQAKTVQRSSDTVEDIVIHVDPNDPPHSLKFILSMLRKKSNVALKVHCHSSLMNSCSVDQSFKTEDCARNKQKLIITVIWKKVSNGLLVLTSPSSNIPIQGEANLARLLGRFLKTYDSGQETLTQTLMMDSCLDACDVISLPNVKQQQKSEALESLNILLGKQKWFGGKEPSLADAVVLSVLKKYGQFSKHASLKQWFQNGQKFIE
uniref:Aminoacyl tRNA synthase complex-interacting multifunctional protein 2-like n=1 Tax=Phallusia mammillata TaxID=59560 RepID=A0A6F9D6Y1_9ASCI|nr:aminoacyl tRNA synthase complex-interacting multifunctional protein 2-like [Phallusia mammillata]